MTRHFLTLTDLSPQELSFLLGLARELKTGGRPAGPRPLDGATILLLFNKPSTRTRISFQAGMNQLGGLAIELRSQDTQLPRGESVPDTARVFARYAQGIVIRTFAQAELEEWRAWSTVPVINALTDLYHPCQTLADLQTIQERRGSLKGCRVAYVGDGNNVLNSWITAACLADIELVAAVPEGYDPDPRVLREAAAFGWRGTPPRIVRDPREAVEGADVIYTDVWTSMGQEEEQARRLAAFAGYCVDDGLLSRAAPEALVMHCLPAHRGEEISQSVVDGPHSVIFDQAENRLHAQKALLLFLLLGRAGCGHVAIPEEL